MKPKIVFLQASLSQPRELKRIRSFLDAGFDVEGYGFDRGFYNINSIVDNENFFNLGFSKSGTNYIEKFIYAKKALQKVFLKYRSENVIYYTFSFNHAMICKFYGRKKTIYEISDLVYGYFKVRLIHILFKEIDKWLIKSSFLAVMTSQGFYNYLFPFNHLTNVHIQPNRLDKYFINVDRGNKPVNCEKIIFSYIGSFRYPNTVFRFARVIGEHYKNHEFHFYGDSEYTDDVKALAKKYTNVIYHGQFRNPNDLQEIYSRINIVVACYDIKTFNERVAEPNKLFEALFFKKPIIVSKNTYLATQVEKFGCGFEIDASKEDNIISFIDSLEITKINEVVNRIEHIPLTRIIDDDAEGIINYINKNSSI